MAGLARGSAICRVLSNLGGLRVLAARYRLALPPNSFAGSEKSTPA